MRKIIQITATPETRLSAFKIVTLCDDGTLWQLSSHNIHWQRLPNVPQGIEPTDAWPR